MNERTGDTRRDPVGDAAKSARVEHVHTVDQCGAECVSQDYREAREAVRRIVFDRRTEFHVQVAVALNRAAVFSRALGEALGEVSRAEAIDALKADIARSLEALK